MCSFCISIKTHDKFDMKLLKNNAKHTLINTHHTVQLFLYLTPTYISTLLWIFCVNKF